MPSYIRPRSEDSVYLRALMKSALPLLNKTAASKTVSQNRVWESRSDLSCHQLAHTSHRTVRRLNVVTLFFWCSVSFLSYPPDTHLIVPFAFSLSALQGSSRCPMLPVLPGLLPIDLPPTQDGPHNPRVFIGYRHCRPVPSSPLEDAPDPLTPVVRCGLRPTQRGPGTVDQQLASVLVPSFTDPE
jgi:hypothetical protein